jgi:hypothetical protein
MSKSTDHDFNEIVYDSVLPEIARAFCSLKKKSQEISLPVRPQRTGKQLHA